MHKKYENSFAILDAFKPDAKYDFKGGIVFSNVTDEELPFHTLSGKALQRLGWDMYQGFWCLFY
jgi:hypothetical protein